MSTPHHSNALQLDRLDREWRRLRHRPRACATIRRWIDDGLIDVGPNAHEAVSDLDRLVALTQPPSGGGRFDDHLLRSLVGIARTDDLAARIVLQRILPGIISGSGNWSTHDPLVHPTDIVVGAAWIAIREFDPGDRHGSIAPALVADALWIGFRRDARRKVSDEVPLPDSVLTVQQAPEHRLDATTALAGTLRAAEAAGVPTAGLEMLRLIVRSGTPTRAARTCGATPRTVRNRRDVATSQIRSALGPDFAEWSDPLVATC